MGDSGRYEVRQIVAAGQAAHLVCGTVPLPRPAIAILEARKTVLVDRADVTLDAVLLQGRLRATYLYPVAEAGPVLPPPGLVWDTAGSTGAPGDSPPASGPLWTTTLDLGFTLAMVTPGARPGMAVAIADAFVSDSVLTVTRADAEGAIQAVADRSLLFLAVTVTQPVLVGEPAGPESTRTGSGTSAAKARPAAPPPPPPQVSAAPGAGPSAAIGRFPPPRGRP